MTETASPRRRKPARIAIVVVAVILAMGIGFVAIVAATSGPAHSEPAGAIAVGEVDGRDIAVVVYRNDTFGHLDLFRVGSMGFSTQAEAFDLDTGERVWDTLLFAEFGGTEAQVLGMSSEYVYVSSAAGLLILDAARGEIVAREGGIHGLGEDYIASIDAYVWDSDAEAVVMLGASGAVLSIPADALEAGPAPDDVAARWANALNTQNDPRSVFSPGVWEHLDNGVPLPGGERIEAAWAADGWDVDVILEEDTGLAAGREGGFAITQTYMPSSSEARFLFQVGDIESGRLISTIEGDSAASALAVTDAGQVVMLSENDSYQGLLLVASADGIRSSVIGERTFLGW